MLNSELGFIPGIKLLYTVKAAVWIPLDSRQGELKGAYISTGIWDLYCLEIVNCKKIKETSG